MSNPEIDAVIAGLSEAQRAAVQDCPCPGMGAGTFTALYLAGLINTDEQADDDQFVVLTPLGRQVRDHLTNQPETK